MFSFLRYVPQGECQSKIVIFLFLFYLVGSRAGGERQWAHLFCKLYPQIVIGALHTWHRKEKKWKGRMFLTKPRVFVQTITYVITFDFYRLSRSIPWPIQIFWPQIYALSSCPQTKANKSPRNVCGKMCKTEKTNKPIICKRLFIKVKSWLLELLKVNFYEQLSFSRPKSPEGCS